MLWSFVGAGAALAAAPEKKPVTHSRIVHAPAFPTLASPFDSRLEARRTEPRSFTPASPAPVNSGLALAAPKPGAIKPLPVSESLLDDVGHLQHPVSTVQTHDWKRQLKTTRLSSHRAADLHLWLGEVSLARDKQPDLAAWHFRVAKALAPLNDPLHFLAAYDNAVGLFYAGAYQDSEGAFTHLLLVKHTANGFSRQNAALWLRHVSACVNYHAYHSALGIPEPPRLDPLCGAAALASRLRVLKLPYDQKTLLSACCVTGEGSSMQDIIDAAPKLGLHAQAVTADDQGLIALPKPVVAYVEHDHFIALTHADKHGVSYLCSDCGPWPGGRVDLTWKQWHTMDAGLYVVVTHPGSAWDRIITAMKTPADRSVEVASTRLNGILPSRLNSLIPGLPLLRGHVVLNSAPVSPVVCGAPPIALHCTLDSHHPVDKPKVASKASASGGDPVDLATGQEEYGPEPDLTVYNPTGPSVVWQRMYETLRGPGQSYPDVVYDATYQSDDFGTGWSQPYNVGVVVSGSTGTVLFANGGKLAFTFSGSPTAGHPLLGTSARSGVPLLLQWDYDGTANGHYEIIFKDRTHWITGSSFAPGSVLPLAQITDRTGNSIYFNYSTVSASKASSGWSLLGSISTGPNATETVLLSIQRNTSAGSDGKVDSYITSVTDHPGTPAARSVFYQATRLNNPNVPYQFSPYYSELTGVSQIVPGGTASAAVPSRFAYGYKPVPNGESNEQINCLHKITTPSPTGSGTSSAYIWYMNDSAADAEGKTNPNYISGAYIPFVGALVDANGNRRLYSSSDGAGHTSGDAASYSQVVVQNSSGATQYSYQVSYDSNLNETARTDGNGHAISVMSYADASSPYSPSKMLDGNAAAASLLPSGQPGSTLSFSPTGSDQPTSPNTWQITNATGTIVATDSAPNGWSFSYTVQSHVNANNTYTLTISSPSTAALGQDQVRAKFPPLAPPPATLGARPAARYFVNVSTYFVLQPPGSIANQGVTTSSYDQYGNVLTETSPRQTTTTYTYDYSAFALGEMNQSQEGTNLATPKAPTVYAYNDTDGYTDGNGLFQPCGLLRSVTAPLPGTTNSTQTATTSYTYDVTGRGQQPLGQLGLGNPLTITRPGNGTVSSITTTLNYTADGSYSQPAALGQPVTVTDNLGKVTHLRYDSQGNAVGVKDALGNETDRTYTIGNEPLQTVLPATGQTGSGHGGSLTGYLYTEPSSFATAAWPAATLQYGPSTTGTLYDEGNTGAIRQTITAYGKEEETLNVTGSTEPVATTYDALYRMKTLTDGGGHVTSYFYNPAGYLAQVVYPGAGTPTAPLSAGTADTLTYPSYDGAGNVLSRVDGNNVTTTYAYTDPESMLTDITYPGGTIGAVHLAYDAYGRRSAMTDGTGSQTYVYDDDDALTSKAVTWPGIAAKTVSYTYNPDGSRKGMTADGRAFTYFYDGVGRMTSLTNPLGERCVWEYRSNGWLQDRYPLDILGNEVATAYYYRNPLGQVTDQSNQDVNGDLLSEFSAITYDGAGNRRSVTASLPDAPATYSGTTSYAYDYGQTANPALNRSQLTGETSTRAGGYTNAFAYDGGTSTGPGNPTSFKGQTQTFNANNQQTGTGYGYDGNGNPTAYNGNVLTFDPENRMTAYGSTQTDGYSGDDLRAWKQTGGARTYFLYDDDQPVGEYGSTGTLTATNTFGADGLVCRRNVSTSTSTYYAFDERGNVSRRLAFGGATASSELYDAYGARTGTTAQADPFGYGAQAGYYTDLETGLILCTHRFYDPSTGRWLTRDPMGYEGGINLYGYVGNDPVNESDPEGLFAPNGPVEPPPPGVWPVLLGLGGGVIRAGGGLLAGAGGVALGTVGGVGILLLGASPAGPANEWGPNEGPNRYRNGAIQSNPTVERLKKMEEYSHCKNGDEKACAELRSWLKKAKTSAEKREIKQAMKFMGCDPKDRSTGDGRR